MKFALRQLLKNPGFTTVAVLTLALSVGANLVIFSVVDGILLRPLPYPDPDRLVAFYSEYPQSDLGRSGSSIPDLYMRRGKLDAVESIGAYKRDSGNVGPSGAGKREEILRVSSDFLETLRVLPAVGHGFSEEQMTFEAHHVAILSDDYWRRNYHADPKVLGRTVQVNGFDKTIVGVMPRGFQFLSTKPGILLPLSSQMDQRGFDRLHSNNDWEMIARLKPGATLSEAQAQMDALDAVMQPQFRWAKEVAAVGYRTVIAPLHADHVAPVRRPLLLLQGGGLFLLLIGAVNLANLFLVRASARTKELAVRQSLGASRFHILRQTMAETLLLAFLGGCVGLGIGAVGVRFLGFFAVDRLPMGLHVVLDGRVMAATLTGAIAVGLIIGLPLTWFNVRGRLVNVLQSASRAGTANRGVQRLRQGFVVSQMALAFVLLSGAGLFSVSLKRAMEISPGFRPEHLLTGHISLIHKNYLDDPSRLSFARRVIERVNELPGVEFAGLVSSAPVAGHAGENDMRVVSVPGRSAALEGLPLSPYVYGIIGDYFRAMGIPLLEGRFLDFSAAKTDGKVCVVDEIFARHNWPDVSALGKLVYDGPAIEPDEKPYRIIGVVGAVKQTELTESSDHGAIYFHLRDLPTGFNGVYLATRTSLAPESLGPVLERTVRNIDPNIPLNDLRTMETRIADTLVARRSPALLASVFALSALVLSAVGTYGVLSFAVAQRRREIGVRMALGALPAQIGSQFLILGLRLLAIGTVVGVFGSWLAGRAMQGILFNVPTFHATTLAGAGLILGGAALAACLWPALRASRVHPMEALRDE